MDHIKISHTLTFFTVRLFSVFVSSYVFFSSTLCALPACGASLKSNECCWFWEDVSGESRIVLKSKDKLFLIYTNIQI